MPKRKTTQQGTVTAKPVIKRRARKPASAGSASAPQAPVASQERAPLSLEPVLAEPAPEIPQPTPEVPQAPPEAPKVPEAINPSEPEPVKEEGLGEARDQLKVSAPEILKEPTPVVQEPPVVSREEGRIEQNIDFDLQKKGGMKVVGEFKKKAEPYQIKELFIRMQKGWREKKFKL